MKGCFTFLLLSISDLLQIKNSLLYISLGNLLYIKQLKALKTVINCLLPKNDNKYTVRAKQSVIMEKRQA